LRRGFSGKVDLREKKDNGPCKEVVLSIGNSYRLLLLTACRRERILELGSVSIGTGAASVI
jgi:hypothetical protein